MEVELRKVDRSMVGTEWLCHRAPKRVRRPDLQREGEVVEKDVPHQPLESTDPLVLRPPAAVGVLLLAGRAILSFD